MGNGNLCDNLGNPTGISVNESNLCEKLKSELSAGQGWEVNVLNELLKALNKAAGQLSGWDDKDKATLITEGLVPAANALKGASWSADQVATLIKDGLVPAANALKDKNGWGSSTIASLIREGFTPAILETSDDRWSLQEILSRLFGDSQSFISLIQNQDFTLSRQATPIFVRDVLTPAVLKQENPDIASLLPSQLPRENKFCPYVRTLLKQWLPQINREAIEATDLAKAICEQGDTLPIHGVLTHIGIYLIAAGWKSETFQNCQQLFKNIQTAINTDQHSFNIRTGGTPKQVAWRDFYRALRSLTKLQVDEHCKLLSDLFTVGRHHQGMLGFYLLKHAEEKKEPYSWARDERWFWETYWVTLPQGLQGLIRLLIGASQRWRSDQKIRVFTLDTSSSHHDTPFRSDQFQAFTLGSWPERDSAYWLATLLSLSDNPKTRQAQDRKLQTWAQTVIQHINAFPDKADITMLLNILLEAIQSPGSVTPQTPAWAQLQAVQICYYLQEVWTEAKALTNLQYAALYYYFDGLLEAGEMEELPVPVLYFPPRDENSGGQPSTAAGNVKYFPPRDRNSGLEATPFQRFTEQEGLMLWVQASVALFQAGTALQNNNPQEASTALQEAGDKLNAAGQALQNNLPAASTALQEAGKKLNAAGQALQNNNPQEASTALQEAGDKLNAAGQALQNNLPAASTALQEAGKKLNAAGQALQNNNLQKAGTKLQEARQALVGEEAAPLIQMFLDNLPNPSPESYRQSILWGQFNAVMWIEKRNYPLAGAKGNAQFSDPASYLYLLREVIDRKLWQQLAPAVKEHAAQKEEDQWKAASLYTLLERMRAEQDRIAAVGLEQIGRFFPFITLDVALATTPLPEEGGGWKVERHYLGEGNWGLVGKVRHYFYSEVGPATHLMLLVGPYGTGKTSVAQVLTHSLVEVTPPDWYILAPKGEDEALEFLPVNRYNVFYLFRQAELSRVELKERLAQLRYYIPPHKNIIVNFAELNAAQPEETRERLGYLESILRELREKAIPKRVLIFMALNYAGLFKEFLDFLAVRPDLVMGGARLSHIWVLRSGRMALHLPEDRKFWEDRTLLPAQKQERSEQGAFINITSIIEKWYNDDQLAGWTREELFLETYLMHRVFGRASLYRHNDLPAQEVMIQRMVRALLNRSTSSKEGSPEEKLAGSSFRTLLWLIKARLFQEALRQANREVPPIFEEIIHRAPGEEKLVSSRQGIEEQFLENWGLVRPRLAEYIGTDALMRLAMRQGFVRNLNAYLMRELELRHAERLAAHRLTDTSGSPVAKYREVLAISALLEGLMSATSYRFGLENIAYRVKIEKIQESDDEAKGRLKTFTFKYETLGKKEKGQPNNITAKLVQPNEQGRKKTQWKVGGDVATFFSGQDSAPFDGAFIFTKENKNQRESIQILLLVDVIHCNRCDSIDHHNKKMKIFGSEDGESGKWQVYQCKEEKGIDFWSFGRALRKTVNQAFKSDITLIAVDIAYEDLNLQSQNDAVQRTFRINSFAIGAAKEQQVIAANQLSVDSLTSLGFEEWK